MKTIIAGCREIRHDTDAIDHVFAAVKASQFKITEVVSGGARGVDKAGEFWAKINSVPVNRFVPLWAKYGNKAGPIRNREMADYADALIAIWDGKSRGTHHMIECATNLGLKVYIYKITL